MFLVIFLEGEKQGGMSKVIFVLH